MCSATAYELDLPGKSLNLCLEYAKNECTEKRRGWKSLNAPNFHIHLLRIMLILCVPLIQHRGQAEAPAGAGRSHVPGRTQHPCTVPVPNDVALWI